MVDQVTPHYVIVQLASPAHNWFAGTFTNLPTDTEVTIGLSMAGNDTKGNAADVKKWMGLMPMMTYADPTQYETYEWFTKDKDGRWVSGDPFKQGEAKCAGAGKVPDQTVIPKEVAEQFLSQDGTYWQAWREVDKAEAVTGINVFRITQQFTLPTATIAMRVPFNYTYLQLLHEKIRNAKFPGVTLELIGTSGEGRPLNIIRLDPLDKEWFETCPTVIVYAREHATEHDSSWAVMGMLRRFLLADPTQRKVRWLLVPILMPDKAISSSFELGDYFRAVKPVMPEIISYATYFVNLINKGKRLDIVINIHNIECNEGANIECPMVNRIYKEVVYNQNDMLFKEANNYGYSAGSPSGWDHGIMGLRLSGWCFVKFRTLDLYYEVNSRYPRCKMTLSQSQQLGAVIALSTNTFTTSAHYRVLRDEMTKWLSQRQSHREEWWKQIGHSENQRTEFDLLTMGY